MRGSANRRRRLRWAVGVLLAVACGCGKPAGGGSASVRGTASFHGRPLAGGTVVFVPDKERGATGPMLTATVAEDGSFRFGNGEKKVAPGWYRVALADPPEWYGTETNGTAFPAALRRPDKSGLEREVKPGTDHVFEFTIELTE